MNSKKLLLIAGALVCTSPLFGEIIDFSAAPINTDIGSFYSGVTFSAGTQAIGPTLDLTDPTYYNFPTVNSTHQATTTLFTPTMQFTFSSSQNWLSFWYDTMYGVTIQLYDSHGNPYYSGAGLDLNDPNGTSGANAFYSTPLADQNIASVTITDDISLGNDFTINQLNTPDATSTFALLGVAGLGLLAFRRKFATQH